MSWRHGKCNCCSQDCELVEVSSTCTLADDSGSCQVFQGCGPMRLRFGTPDIVSGRTDIDDHYDYPADGQNFKWSGGTELSIFARDRTIECGGTVFFARHMRLQYGCPNDPEKWTDETVLGRYAKIQLPSDCSGCIIRISVNYFAAVGDNCDSCWYDNVPNCPMVVTFEQMPAYVDFELSQFGFRCSQIPLANTPICSSEPECLGDLDPCPTYLQAAQACYSEARANVGLTYNVAARGCKVELIEDAEEPGIHCGPYPNYLADCGRIFAIINDVELSYTCKSSVAYSFYARIDDIDTGLLATGVIKGRKTIVGSASHITNVDGGALLACSTNSYCLSYGTMGGNYISPAFGEPTVQLGTFNPAIGGDICRAVYDILAGTYTLSTVGVPTRPTMQVTLE